MKINQLLRGLPKIDELIKENIVDLEELVRLGFDNIKLTKRLEDKRMLY